MQAPWICIHFLQELVCRQQNKRKEEEDPMSFISLLQPLFLTTVNIEYNHSKLIRAPRAGTCAGSLCWGDEEKRLAARLLRAT
jgi:hypothetical protein